MTSVKDFFQLNCPHKTSVHIPQETVSSQTIVDLLLGHLKQTGWKGIMHVINFHNNPILQIYDELESPCWKHYIIANYIKTGKGWALSCICRNYICIILVFFPASISYAIRASYSKLPISKHSNLTSAKVLIDQATML